MRVARATHLIKSWNIIALQLAAVSLSGTLRFAQCIYTIINGSAEIGADKVNFSSSDVYHFTYLRSKSSGESQISIINSRIKSVASQYTVSIIRRMGKGFPWLL